MLVEALMKPSPERTVQHIKIFRQYFTVDETWIPHFTTELKNRHLTTVI